MRTSLLASFLLIAGCGDPAMTAAPPVGSAAPDVPTVRLPGPSVIYVDNKACPAKGNGSFIRPFCHVQDGLDAGVERGMPVYVLPGRYDETLRMRPTSGRAIVTLIGIDQPVLHGVGPVVDVSAGSGTWVDLTLEGFRIEGGTSPAAGHGVSCVVGADAQARVVLKRTVISTNEAEGVHAEHCTVDADQLIVKDNGRGGINLQNGSFHLANVLVFNNGFTGGLAGGIHAVPLTGKYDSLVNVTVVGNAGTGLDCGSQPFTAFNVLSTGNTVSDVATTCSPVFSAWADATGTGNVDTRSCKQSDLFADPAYHLNAQAPAECSLAGRGLAALGNVSAPTHDLDGERRVTPDIGAYRTE